LEFFRGFDRERNEALYSLHFYGSEEVVTMKTVALIVVAILLVLSQGLLANTAISGGMPDPFEINSIKATENSIELDIAATFSQNIATIVDDPDDTTTWVQRWDEGQPAPVGIPPVGWFDVAGNAAFETYQINVMWSGSDVHFQIFTDFPETGYGDGEPYGYPSGGLYQLADLAFDLNLDGVWETGIALIDHGVIPEDTLESQPPGYGKPADNFVKGNIYSVTAWFSPEDIHYYHWAYAGRYDMDAAKLPFSWMRLGTRIGEAEITYTDLGATHPTYRIDIILRGINTSRQWDHFSIYWGTGNCSNDIITGTVKGQRKTIPAMNEWGLMIFSLLMVFSALWVLRKKIRWQEPKSGI